MRQYHDAISRIGTNAWNWQTSAIREQRVQRFLLERGVTGDQIQTHAVGEEDAVNHAEDDERDRAVKLWVHPKSQDDQPPPRRVPPRPKITRHFKLAKLTGISASQSARLAQFLRGRAARSAAIEAIFFIV